MTLIETCHFFGQLIAMSNAWLHAARQVINDAFQSIETGINDAFQSIETGITILPFVFMCLTVGIQNCPELSFYFPLLSMYITCTLCPNKIGLLVKKYLFNDLDSK